MLKYIVFETSMYFPNLEVAVSTRNRDDEDYPTIFTVVYMFDTETCKKYKPTEEQMKIFNYIKDFGEEVYNQMKNTISI